MRPDAVNDVASATEDGAVVTGTVATNDSDVDVGDTRTYALDAPVAGLTLDSNGSYSFDPSSYDSLAFGATQIVVATYTLTDGQAATDTATLTITVTGVNDAPDAVNDVAGATEDGAVVTGTVATNDSDADAGDTRAYALVAPVAGLTLAADGSYSFDPSSYDLAGLRRDPDRGRHLHDDRRSGRDRHGDADDHGHRHQRCSRCGERRRRRDRGRRGRDRHRRDQRQRRRCRRHPDLCARRSGRRADARRRRQLQLRSCRATTRWPSGATQIVVATYTMTDGQGATDTATLTITVTGVNDAPDAVNDVAGATEDGAVVTGTVATNDSDVDAGDTRTYALVAPVAGLTLAADGSYSFDPSSYDSLALRRDPERGRHLHADRRPGRDGHGDADDHGHRRQRCSGRGATTRRARPRTARS